MYVKLFERLLKSSLMDTDVQTRWAWVALLLQSDQDGNVYGTIPALARAANLSVDDMRAAMDVFTAPDLESTTDEDDGRRVLNIAPNQWLIVNYEKYRDTKDIDTERAKTRERVRRHRQKLKSPKCNATCNACNADVTHVTPPVTCRNAIQIQMQKQDPGTNVPSSSSPAGEDLTSRGVFGSGAIPSDIPRILGPLMEKALREQHEDTSDDPKLDTPPRRVFAHWKATMKHPKAKLDPKRIGAIRRALKWGYNESDLIAAIDGCAATPYNMGDNDRGQRYDGLDLILRDAAHIDRFIANAANPPKPREITQLRQLAPAFKTARERAQEREAQENIERMRRFYDLYQPPGMPFDPDADPAEWKRAREEYDARQAAGVRHDKG